MYLLVQYIYHSIHKHTHYIPTWVWSRGALAGCPSRSRCPWCESFRCQSGRRLTATKQVLKGLIKDISRYISRDVPKNETYICMYKIWENFYRAAFQKLNSYVSLAVGCMTVSKLVLSQSGRWLHDSIKTSFMSVWPLLASWQHQNMFKDAGASVYNLPLSSLT